jgi:FAD/FMN-containing dehydrogenase
MDASYNTLSTENWFVRSNPHSFSREPIFKYWDFADCYATRSATAWGKPICIIQPRSTADVQSIVSHLGQKRVRFAIRSGGHLPSPMGANTNDGVLIDLSALNAKIYDAKSSTVKIGAGQRWGDVYGYLNQWRVTVVGGRILDVGVGGLILGSGLSYLSDLYGMACDNVVNFEVVIADGSLVNANATSNKGLYKALKGGANNFGMSHTCIDRRRY